MRERCWALVGQRRGAFWLARRRRPATGEPTRVEFDAAWTLAREESRGDVVGFCHTHPCGLVGLSPVDVRTMRAWVGALGKPLLCLIETPEGLSAFRFDRDRSRGAQLAACVRFPRGVVVVFDPPKGSAAKG